MITITHPQSKYGPIDDSNGFILKWTSTIDGQTDYEILYKIKGFDSWSTSGKINSTSSEYNLLNIYNNLGVDFTEIQYKVKLWYSTTNETGELTGTEESDTYTLIFSQPISGYFNIFDGDNINRYPLFSNINNNNNPTFNIQTNNGKMSTILVDNDNPLNSNLKIKIGDSIKSVASNSPNLSNGYIQRSDPTELIQSGTTESSDYYYYSVRDTQKMSSSNNIRYYYKYKTSYQTYTWSTQNTEYIDYYYWHNGWDEPGYWGSHWSTYEKTYWYTFNRYYYDTRYVSYSYNTYYYKYYYIYDSTTYNTLTSYSYKYYSYAI